MKIEELAKRFYEGKNFSRAKDWTRTKENGDTFWYCEGDIVAIRWGDDKTMITILDHTCYMPSINRQNALKKLMGI